MKRQTKSQREAARLASVLQRVEDIYAGAMGNADPDSDNLCPGIEDVARIRWALQGRFGLDEDHFIFNNAFLGEFATPKQLAECLVRQDLDLPRKESTNG